MSSTPPSTLLDANKLMIKKAAEHDSTVKEDSYLSNRHEVSQVHELKMIALSSARLLYGSGRDYFYDVTIGSCAQISKYTVVLTCTINKNNNNTTTTTEVLRMIVDACVLVALRRLVHGLQTDTGLVLLKYKVGDHINGQQGTTDGDGVFNLRNGSCVENREGGGDLDDIRPLKRRRHYDNYRTLSFEANTPGRRNNLPMKSNRGLDY